MAGSNGQDGFFEKIKRAISELPLRYPLPIILSVAILCVLSIWSLRNFQIKLSLFDELPPDHPQLKRFKYVSENYGGTDILFVGIEGDNLSRMKECALRVQEELKKMPEIKSVRGKIDVEFFKNHALYYLDKKDLQDLYDLMRRRKEELKKLFMTYSFPDFISKWADLISQEILERETIEEDKKDEFVESISAIRLWVEQIRQAMIDGKLDPEKYKDTFRKAFLMYGEQKREGYSVYEDFLISEDKSTILITALPSKPADDYNFNKIIYDKVMDMKEKVQKAECAGLNLHIGGNHIGLEEQRRIVIQDMARTGNLSYILTMAVFLTVFRGFFGALSFTIFLAVGVVLTFGFLMLTYGYVTVISALFGSILIGMGIDWGVYVFSRWKEKIQEGQRGDKTISQSVYELIPPMFEAGITTSLGFLCVYVSQIKGAKILAVVAFAGILIYLILSWIFLPALMKIFSKQLAKGRVSGVVDLFFEKVADFVVSKSKYIVAISVPVIVLVIFFGFEKFGFEYNLRKILPHLEAIKAEDFIVSKFGRSKDYTVILAKDIEELKEKVMKLKQTETFGSVESILVFFPDDIKDKLQYVEEINKVVSDFRGGVIPSGGVFPALYIKSSFERMMSVASAMAELAVLSGIFEAEDEAKKLKQDIVKLLDSIDKLGDGNVDISALQRVNAESLDEFLQDLKTAAKSRGFELHDLPEDIRREFIGKDNSFIIFAYPKRPIWEDEIYMRKNLSEALSVDPSAFGVSALFLSVTERAKRDLLLSLSLAFSLTFIFLFLAFRRILPTILAMIPVTIGLIFAASFSALIGIKAHYINIGAFAIIAGTAEDYGVQIIYRLFSEKNVRKAVAGTGRAIFIAGLSTIAGFCTVALARFPGLSHFGILITIGLSTSIFVSVFLLPAFLEIFKEKILKSYEEK